MDFRAAAAALPPPPAAHMPALFTQPPALPPPPSQAGLFLYPGLSSPVKPPSHLLPSHKVSPRNTATVPPLLQSPAPPSSAQQPPSHTSAPVTTAASQANSFAAALKSLARNAGGTDAKESAPQKPARDAAPAMSPKRGPLHVPRAPHTDNPPPVVAIAPTPTHQRSREPPAVSSAPDITKPAEVTSQLSAASGDALSRAAAGATGFQPYRADEQQRLLESLYPGYAAAAAAAAAGSLYPPPARPGYTPAPRRPEDRYLESLYPLQHPLQHTLYGLEEQLYLERLGLLRPPLGVGGLSPYSPLLSAAGRYPPPPELLHSPLYMSQSLYLQERLKLEEDTRRKLETERERTERERTERSERSREQPTSHAVTPAVRERSPVRPAGVVTSSGALPSELRTPGPVRESRSPAERRSASSGGEQQSSPAAYRPYLASPVPRPAAAAPRDPPREPPLDLRTGTGPGAGTTARSAPPLAKPRSHKKTTVVRPFEDTVSVPQEPAAPAPPPADAPLNLSERGRSERTEPPPPPPPAAAAAVAAVAAAEQLTSTLDRREELRRRGLQLDEAEPPVRHLDLLTGPPCKTVSSPEKLQFLAHVGLTTHSYKNDVELKKCERRAALHLPLSASTSPEGCRAEPIPEPEPEPEPRPCSRLTAALNEAADMPAKLLFLERLGLRPVTATGAGAGAGAPASSAGSAGSGGSSSGSSNGGGSPSGGASTSGGGSPSQRKTDGSTRRDAPSDDKGRRHRSSPSSRSSRSSRPSSQAAAAAAARQAASPPAAEVSPRLAVPGTAWPGMQAVTQMYTAYNKERAAAVDQARRTQERLRAQQTRLEETSRGLALRLNRQVAFRSLQWRQREAIQEQLDRLGALVRALPTRARRKH